MLVEVALSKRTKFDVVEAGATSAGTEVLTSAIDTAGYDGVLLILTSMATANAGNHFKAKQAADSGGSPDDYSDIAGSKATPATNGDGAFIDIFKPQKRYIKGSVIRAGANSVTGPIIAMKYNGRIFPQENNVTNVMIGVTLIEPAEGTA